jgi:hypothetical protein
MCNDRNDHEYFQISDNHNVEFSPDNGTSFFLISNYLNRTFGSVFYIHKLIKEIQKTFAALFLSQESNHLSSQTSNRR